jgi:hypothetical protein
LSILVLTIFSTLQYDVDADKAEGARPLVPDDSPAPAKRAMKADASKIDSYIEKISAYRAGGDGGKCLKILKAYVGNVVDNPSDEKFKSINMDNKVFKTKVKPFIGAKNLLLAVGFSQAEGQDQLVLDEDADLVMLENTKQKLEAAIVKYG